MTLQLRPIARTRTKMRLVWHLIWYNLALQLLAYSAHLNMMLGENGRENQSQRDDVDHSTYASHRP